MGIYKFNIVAYEGAVPEHFACQDKVLPIDCGDNLIHIKSADFGRKVKFLFLCDITKVKTVIGVVIGLCIVNLLQCRKDKH